MSDREKKYKARKKRGKEKRRAIKSDTTLSTAIAYEPEQETNMEK